MPSSKKQSAQKQESATDQAPQQASSKRSATTYIIYVVIAAVLVIIAVALVLPSAPSIKIAQNRSINSTPIYMSPAQAQLILGSSLYNYTTYDIFNQVNPLNASFFAGIVPQLAGNLTSGWTTLAAGSSPTINSSLEYIVMTTNDTAAIANLLGGDINSSIGVAPSYTTSGLYNGLQYTYYEYGNATTTAQILYGYKGGNAVLLLIGGSAPYLANQSLIVTIAANDTPLH